MESFLWHVHLRHGNSDGKGRERCVLLSEVLHLVLYGYIVSFSSASFPARIPPNTDGSRVSSKSSRTQSEVVSHKRKFNKKFFFRENIMSCTFSIVCLFFLKYAHKMSCTSCFSDQAKCPRKNIENSTRCTQWPIIVSSFSVLSG